MTTTRATTRTRSSSCLGFVLALALAAFLIPAALCASVPVSSPAIDELDVTGWQRGRATFYGRDGYSIHDGACHYGGIPYPYYVGALSDWWPEYINSAYEHNKCGTCFEIQCDPNGRSYCRQDRLNTSIILKVTDRCPCKHENPSNQRWCCGDMPHYDLSYEAFGELASHTGGWVYLQWREIQCPDAVGLGGEMLTDPLNWTPHCNKDGDKTLADAAREEGLTTFLEATWRAGPDVWDRLSSKAKDSTVVAPTNEAFEAFAAEMGLTVSEFLEEPSLTDIVKHHFVKDRIDFRASSCSDVQPYEHSCAQEKEWEKCASPDFKKNGYCKETCGVCDGLETLGGEDLAISGNGTVIDGAKMEREVVACNGNLAVVSNVLFSLCKAEDGPGGVLQVAHEAGLKMFTEAAWRAMALGNGENLLGVGDERGLYTLLAPTDGAFQAFLKKFRYEKFEDFLESKDLAPIMKQHVLKGNQHIGFHEKSCHDLALPEGILEDISANTTQCEDLANIGFCSNEWIANGYCRRSCGRCGRRHVKMIDGQELEIKESLIDGEDLLQVFSEYAPEGAPTGSMKVKVADSVVLVPDIKACNGLVNIVNKVIF
ncbi:hypothetical protein HOP50_04g34050 [Chloropicon primus]|uniref:FAS1 domain-containing protein n=1 Tax=Chloropicon primus TaxID=1764295 RepID=A0A5B8MJT7_9CHLO|nr:hypothetical protein A3770_04p33960 [Chloropicon primus]UPR00091.1 hypothetical protein HOP50_04g34050 [Chloropicon primus]|mmetsp:Transcript_7691/g.21955  ORF Transcript_7691/g.21955 Transcript_7691/m.21955 type:complete len:598 (-) Transcript_7691:1742-3535(-)|eukprot:QDZ20878.1 hypothetical protein A3770_04p33960 [Chloropicon primus]